MLKPKKENPNWITVGQGDKDKAPVVSVPRTLPPFNMGSQENAKPIAGQGNK